MEGRLHGRQRERALLACLLDEARGGHGCLVLLSGEAGIGKTALIEDFAADAELAGCLVLTGRCYDLSTTPPYGPWLEIVRASPCVEGLSSLSDILRRGREEGPSPGTSGELLARALELIGALARRAPLVLVLDDLHGADDASLDALRRIAREIRDLPVLLIAAFRDDDLPRRHPLAELIPLLVREARPERIALRALDMDDLRAWVAACYALEPPDEQRLVDYLARYSGGIPLFVAELLRSLEDDRIIESTAEGHRLGDLDGAAVPQLRRQILELRVSRLTPESRELLAIAAVIGQRISHDLWQRVAGVDPELLERAAAEAVALGLLVADPREPALSFRHALIRELLYQDILPHRRQLWHRRIAEELQSAGDPDPDEVAHHLRLASDSRAIEWLMRAGERAHREACAFQTAARRYQAALELAGTRTELLTTRGWLLARLASVLRYADPGQSVALLNDAHEIGQRTCDEGLTSMSVWMRGTMRNLAGENGLDDAIAGDEALSKLSDAELRRIQEHFGGRLPDPVARSAGLVWWHGYHGRPADALELAERVEAQLDQSQRPDIDRAISGAGRAFALSVLGRVDEARAAYLQARRLLAEHDYHFHVTTVTAFEFHLLDLPYFTTDLAELRRKRKELLAFATNALGELVDIPPEYTVCGYLLITGEWDMLNGLRETVRTAPRSFFSWNYAVPTLATHARYTGRTAIASDLVRLMLPQGSQTEVGATGVPLRSLEALRLGAHLALDAGDPNEARRWLEAHERWLDWSGYLLGQADGALLWARLERESGDDAGARRHAERALELATTPRQPLALLETHRFLGRLDRDERRFDAAAAHLSTALELATACAAPFERAVTLMSIARLDVATGQGRQAGSRLDEAIEITDRLGAMPALERARRMRAELAARPTPGLLSARELEVLRLVAEGLTDREVAERLHISPRTVNQHLRSIYRKLGVGSRAAATRRALELGMI